MTRIFQKSLSVKSSDTHASVPEGAKIYSSATKRRGHFSDGFRSSRQILALANAGSEVFWRWQRLPRVLTIIETLDTLHTHPCDA